MKLFVFLMLSCIPSLSALSQEDPYRNIPDAPESYSSGNILARYLDGMGYRYYWATEGLRAQDLQFRPENDGRSIQETMEHIYSLCVVIRNTFTGTPNIGPEVLPEMTFDELRSATLELIQNSSELAKQKTSFTELDIVFSAGEQKASYPFWNLINGPMADVVYHTGQVVSFRRSSGNPIYEGVNVFTGETR